MANQKATNVTWHDGEVSREDRYNILRQRGVTIWFTGLSGSGKSTIAVALEQALYQSDMLDEVRQFPEQESTLVGEKGILLSGGQKQRLSLSRGLYTPCKLMVLDNVLSAVDNETERFLLDQIFNHSRSAATLIISHRATVLEKVDTILVLNAGRIVAQGTHAELLLSSEEYRHNWQLQQHDNEAVA